MTYEQYIVGFADYYACNREQRMGQAAFNYLYLSRPDLSEHIRASNLDPFYRDDILPDFLNWVGMFW